MEKQKSSSGKLFRGEMVYDALILGAGVGGLAAGLSFVEGGFDNFLIVEARERIGGRVVSKEMEHGFVAELGAEWIGKTHRHLLSIIQNAPEDYKKYLTLIDHTFDFKTQIHRSTPSHVSQIMLRHHEQLDDFLQQFDGYTDKKIQRYDDYSLHALLVELGLSMHDIEEIDLEESDEFGESIRYFSAARFIIDKVIGGKNMHFDYKLKNGNQKLCEYMADRIGADRLSLSTPVTDILLHKDEGVYELRARGRVFYAQSILSTLPLSVMHKIDWHGTLPEEIKQLSHQISYGRIIKAGFLLKDKDNRIDENFGLIDDTLLHTLYNSGKGSNDQNHKLIGIYATGDRAFILAKLDQEQMFEQLKTHKPFGHCKSYTDSYRYYWGEDPYVLGSYAIIPPGLCYKVPKICKKSYNGLYFGGEYASLGFQGFMEGAIETAQDHSLKIMKHLKTSK